MQYVKAGKQTLITRLLQQLSVKSTAPARTYPLPVELLNLPSLQASALSPSGSPSTSSITVRSPSRAIKYPDLAKWETDISQLYPCPCGTLRCERERKPLRYRILIQAGQAIRREEP